MKKSLFRLWCQNLWMSNCDEHTEWDGLPMTMAEYFQQYKYWLKREYKHQQRVRK